jgi:hypothetical protein
MKIRKAADSEDIRASLADGGSGPASSISTNIRASLQGAIAKTMIEKNA